MCFSINSQADVKLKTTQSWDGGNIHYPDGQAEITSMILQLEDNQVSPFHCHPVPTMGYVLKGEIEVETAPGKTARFKQGDSVIEVMKTVHRGKAINGPVEIIVFYAGSTTLPTTVMSDDQHNQHLCH